jgi:hypothetical protein
VIDAAREQQAIENAAAIRKLQLATEWVALHPGDEVDTSIEWGMRDLEIAGDGAPTIDEGAVAEFARALGVSTDSGRIYLGDAVELKYRLPRIWQRVMDGEVPVWKARKVAANTRSLPPEAAAYVDKALYFVLRKCSFAEIDRQVDKARAEYDPQAAEERRKKEAEHRHFDVDLQHVTPEGQVYLGGLVDLAVGIKLDQFVTAKASTLDPELPLDVRRAMAVGMLADPDEDSGSGSKHDVIVYTHVRPEQVMVDVDNTRTAITPGQLQEWCQQAGTRVIVKPVIDLNAELYTPEYRPTPAMAEQIQLRYRECVFPDCHRPATGCDIDHIIPWPLGPTASWNLAPLCRGHHRLKTHTAWNYTWVPGIGFVWTDPSGRRHIN